MDNPTDPATKSIEFGFHFVNSNDRARVIMTGLVGDEALELHDRSLPYQDILHTITRNSLIALQLSPTLLADFEDVLDGDTLIIMIYGVDAAELTKEINSAVSLYDVRVTKQRLTAEGRLDLIRAEQCPGCGALVNLSGFPKTPYIFCRFCDTLFDAKGTIVVEESSFRHCDECRFFDENRRYRYILFYHLIVVSGYRNEIVELCHNCAHDTFIRVYPKPMCVR